MLLTNGVSLTGQPTSLSSAFDPAVEFLELGLTCNGQTTWKLYGPDLNGAYGRMQGVGGLESVRTQLDPPVDLVKDARGNITYCSETGSGSLWWNTSRPTGYGAVPGFEPPPMGFGSSLGEAAAWRGKWKDITGLYWLGARYYNPESGSFLSSDPVWNGRDPNYYSFCGGNPVTYFDCDGRCLEGAGTAAGNLLSGTAALANNAYYLISYGVASLAYGSERANQWYGQNLQGLENAVGGTAQTAYNVAATATYGLISPLAPDFAYNNYGGSVQQLLGQAPALYGGNNQSLPYQIGYGAVNAATMLLGGEEAEVGNLGKVGELTDAGAQAEWIAETTPARNPNVYEALFDAPISGTTRTAQRASANDFLANQLQNNAQLNGMFNQELGENVLQHMESGSGSSFLNPPGTVWHHPFDNPDVMQLLRTGEHTAPSLQPVLHPGGVGGFGNFYGP